MFSVGKCDHAGEFRTQEISVFIPGKIMIVIYTRKYINLLWHKPDRGRSAGLVDKLNALYLLSKGVIRAVDMTSFNRIFDINVI